MLARIFHQSFGLQTINIISSQLIRTNYFFEPTILEPNGDHHLKPLLSANKRTNKSIHGLKLGLLSSILLFTLFSSNSFAVKLYKWVDSEGKVSYQDTPPPSGQAYEEKSYTDEGSNNSSNPDVTRARAIRDNPVTLYTADNCASCDSVRTILEMNKVPFDQVAVDKNTELQKKLKDIAGSIRVPTLTIGDTVVRELDRNRIEDALKDGGYANTDGANNNLDNTLDKKAANQTAVEPQ